MDRAKFYTEGEYYFFCYGDFSLRTVKGDDFDYYTTSGKRSRGLVSNLSLDKEIVSSMNAIDFGKLYGVAKYAGNGTFIDEVSGVQFKGTRYDKKTEYDMTDYDEILLSFGRDNYNADLLIKHTPDELFYIGKRLLPISEDETYLSEDEKKAIVSFRENVVLDTIPNADEVRKIVQTVSAIALVKVQADIEKGFEAGFSQMYDKATLEYREYKRLHADEIFNNYFGFTLRKK